MIIINLTDGEVMKFHSSDYNVSTSDEWLYVRKNINGVYKDLRYMIPLSSIKYVSFD